MGKKVTFASKDEIRETPRNRSIEIKQRSINLVSLNKKKLKKDFPNGIKALLEEKGDLEKLINVKHGPLKMEWEHRVNKINDELDLFGYYQYIIKEPNNYIKLLDQRFHDSGEDDVKEYKKLAKRNLYSSYSLSPTSNNTILNGKKTRNVSRNGGKKRNCITIKRKLKRRI